MSIEIHKSINSSIKNGTTPLIGENWSRLKNNNFSKMHSISSYLAMFSPSLPNFFIKKYSKENDLVMDNFSGRGTTGLVSRELNRKFIGTDLNPYAIVLSRSKIENYLKNDIIDLVCKMEKKFNENKVHFYNKTKQKKHKELLIYFSRKTLAQLIFLREEIGKTWRENSSENNAILAFALGLMHGPMKKNGETIYFSLSMPNTISMSPNYVEKYSKINNLKKPKGNIFIKIINRINDKYDENIIPKKFEGLIFENNATIENENIKDDTVNLVITSPPYLNIVNYTNSNWLKLWLLGYDRNKLKKEINLTDNLNLENYKFFIQNYLNSIYKKIKKNGIVCLVVGDIFEMPLIENVWNSIKNDVNFKFKEIYKDNSYSQNYKITNMLNSKKGRATIIEKVLVLVK
ncbi:MAG: DNA methyltransferase [Metamycoplasmataceae bacterium]